MTKYKFRIIGAPPEEAIKEIEINDDLTVAEVKEIIKKELNLPSRVSDIKLIRKNEKNL